jgi:hypothetical protein
VDVSKSKDLAYQFGIDSIPSLYLYRGNKVYHYDGPLVVDSVVEWCTSGYKKQEPIPYMQSPMGFVGQAKGALVSWTNKIYNIVPNIAEAYHITPFMAVMVVVCGLAGGILLFTCLFVFVSVSEHAKND